MANTPNFSTTYPVTIPTLADAADIAKAFKIYHNGSENTSEVFDNSVAGALAKKAPINSPVFTGTVDLSLATISLPDSIITTGKIANGTIINEDISASAAIDQSKINGLGAALDAKAPTSGPTFTGTTAVATLTVSGNATVSGNITGTLLGNATTATTASNATNATKGAVYGSGFAKITVLAGSTGPANPSTGDVWISF